MHIAYLKVVLYYNFNDKNMGIKQKKIGQQRCSTKKSQCTDPQVGSDKRLDTYVILTHVYQKVQSQHYYSQKVVVLRKFHRLSGKPMHIATVTFKST